MSLSILIVILSLLAIPSSAYAYIDPQSGSLIFQTVIAVFLGAIFTIKTYWYKFKGLFKKNERDDLGK